MVIGSQSVIDHPCYIKSSAVQAMAYEEFASLWAMFRCARIVQRKTQRPGRLPRGGPLARNQKAFLAAAGDAKAVRSVDGFHFTTVLGMPRVS